MKTKLTPELQKKLIKCIRAGSYIVVACRAVGISEFAFYDWIKKGKKGIEPYTKFTKSVRQAQARGELKIYSEIRSQVKKDWRAGMEILARKYPKRWGKKDKLTPETPKTLKAPPESKQVIEFRKKFELLTPEQKKQVIELSIRREKEIEELNDKFKRAVIGNVNNGDGKNG